MKPFGASFKFICLISNLLAIYLSCSSCKRCDSKTFVDQPTVGTANKARRLLCALYRLDGERCCELFGLTYGAREVFVENDFVCHRHHRLSCSLFFGTLVQLLMRSCITIAPQLDCVILERRRTRIPSNERPPFLQPNSTRIKSPIVHGWAAIVTPTGPHSSGPQTLLPSVTASPANPHSFLAIIRLLCLEKIQRTILFGFILDYRRTDLE